MLEPSFKPSQAPHPACLKHTDFNMLTATTTGDSLKQNE